MYLIDHELSWGLSTGLFMQ